MAKLNRELLRTRRHLRGRQKIKGSAQRPRLCVYGSLKNIYVQLVDDDKGVTVASASTVDEIYSSDKKSKGNVKYAKEIGKKIAQIAKEKSITEIVFDKSGYKYHGKIKALADAAREGGLKF